jgi:hypothetical protein
MLLVAFIKTVVCVVLFVMVCGSYPLTVIGVVVFVIVCGSCPLTGICVVVFVMVCGSRPLTGICVIVIVMVMWVVSIDLLAWSILFIFHLNVLELVYLQCLCACGQKVCYHCANEFAVCMP